MSENIQGGTYGVEVEGSVADSLIVAEGSGSDSTDTSSNPNGEVATIAEDQPQETEQQAEAEDAPSIDELEIDGEVYSYDDLKTALEDSGNRNEWQKSNTEKSQELAALRKELESERSQWDALRKDEDMMETMKDYLGSDHALFNETKEEPSNENMQDTMDAVDRVQELEDKIDNIVVAQQAAEAVENDINSLVKNHPELDGKDEAVREVLITAHEKGMTNLEDAFVLTYHQAAVDSSFAKAVKTLEEAQSRKSIPEADVKHSGERSVSNTKPQNFDEAREMGLQYDLYQ